MELDHYSHHSTSSPKSTDDGNRRQPHHLFSADCAGSEEQTPKHVNHTMSGPASHDDRKRRTHQDPSTKTLDFEKENKGSNLMSPLWSVMVRSPTPHFHHKTPKSTSPDDLKRRTHRKERANSADGRMRLDQHSDHSTTSPDDHKRRTHRKERTKRVDTKMRMDKHPNRSMTSTTFHDDRKRRTHRKERAKSADGRMRLDQHSDHSIPNTTSPEDCQRGTHRKERTRSAEKMTRMDEHSSHSMRSTTSPDDHRRRAHRKKRAKSVDGWEEPQKHNHRRHHSRSRHSKSEDSSKIHRLRRHSWDLKDIKLNAAAQGQRQKEPLQLKSFGSLRDPHHKSFRDPRYVQHIGSSTDNFRSNVRQLDWASERDMQYHHCSTSDSSLSHSLDLEGVDRVDAMKRRKEGLRIVFVRQVDRAGEEGMQRHHFPTPDSSLSHSLEDDQQMDTMERQSEDPRVRQLDFAGDRRMQRHFSTPDSSMSHSLDMEAVERMERQNEDLRVRIGMLEIQRENDALKTRIDKIESREVSVCSDQTFDHIYKQNKKPKARRPQRRLFLGWDDFSLKIRSISIVVCFLVVVGISALILSHPGDKDDGNRPLTDDDPIFSSTIFPVWMKQNDA